MSSFECGRFDEPEVLDLLIDDSEEDVEVIPAESVHAQRSAPVVIVYPAFDEIPRLLLVDLLQDSAKVVVGALDRLIDLIKLRDKNTLAVAQARRKDALSIGAIAVIILLLPKWQSDEVHWRALRLLTMLIFENEEAQRALARAGGVEACVNALRVYPKSLPVQVSACAALAIMFQLDDAKRRFVFELDGIRLVAEAMGNFHQSAYLQGNCCELLRSLARHEEYRDPLSKAGVVLAVSGALEHPDDRVKDLAKEFMKTMFP